FHCQDLLEFFVELEGLLRNRAVVEFTQQRSQQIVRIALRVEDKCGAGGFTIPFQDVEEQRRFAHPRFCNERTKAQIALDPVDERRERLSVSGARKEEPRVRGYPKRLLAKSEILQKHVNGLAGPPAQPDGKSR